MLRSAFAMPTKAQTPLNCRALDGQCALKQRRGFLQGDKETDGLGVSGDEILMLQRVSARELLLVHEVLVGRWPDTEIAKLNP